MKLRWFLLFSFVATASDWPQWRGPQRTGISQETGLLKEWPKDGPKLLWQISDIGEGYATPAVVGARLYLLSNRGMENESVEALSVKDGKKLWDTIVPPGPGRHGAEIMTLASGATGDATGASATLGGAAITGDTPWDGKWSALSADPRTGISLTVRATTAAIVRIQNRG